MKTLEDRFWSKVNIVPDEDSCWEWTAGLEDGYGKFFFHGENERAHRVAYQLEVGPIPAGELVRHKCDNRKCCRPKHVVLGTIQDNMKDMTERDRQAKGEKKANARLTDAQVLEIRIRHQDGETLAALATEFDISPKTLSMVCCGDTWKHVGGPRRQRRTFGV